jgi:hypothetical protein
MLFFAVVGLSACGVTESVVGQNEGDATPDSAELSASSRTYVGLRLDPRRCAAPMCGGYFVHDVNRVNLSEVYVSGLDFSSSGLSDADQQRVYEAIGDVVLRGKLGPKESVHGTRPFIVSDAFRGMPGKPPASTDFFFKVKSSSAQLSSTKANQTSATQFQELSLTALGFVDQKWLSQRTLEQGAIVSGALVQDGDVARLEGSNVFVKLPEHTACPAIAAAACPAGQVRTYARTPDRCIVPDACVTQGVCNFLVPNCGDGYTSVSFKTAPRGCNSVVCDPSWLSE